MLVESVILLALGFYIYHWWSKGYWARKKVFSLDGEFFFGHTRKILFNKLDLTVFFDQIYKEHKDKKLIGLYNFMEPLLLVTDPEYIRRIFVTDFNSFPVAVLKFSMKNDLLLSYNPFVTYGESWKYRRGIHTSALSLAKLRENTSLMHKTCQSMIKYVQDSDGKPVKVSDMTKYYTIDNAVSISFGYEPSAFVNPEDGFRKHAGKSMLDKSIGFASIASIFCPILINILSLRFLSEETNVFFREMAKNIYNFRKESKVVRNDLVDQLLKIEQKQISEGKKGFGEGEIAGHMLTTYLDAVETSSILLNFLFLEVANRPEVQDRLRREMLAVGKEPEDFDFDKVNSLVYLNMVFNEILRLHPLLFFFSRLCVQNTKLGDVEVEKGTKVFIPYCSIINDPEFYPDPESFDPERFSPDNLNSNIKRTFFPFGDGPKQCLGMKYAALQIKLAVISIIIKFKLIPTNKIDGKKVENSKEQTILQKPDDEETIIFESI